MEMDYFAFVEEIRRKIIAETGFAEDKVYFEQKGGTFARTGDRLFVECASNEDSREVCGIYIEELYDRYLEGKSIDEMAQDVVGEIRRVKREGYFENTRKLVSYETAKDSLFIRLINFDRNKTDLKNAVYRTLGDIALVLYMKIGEEGGCMTSVKIRKEYMKKWEIPENEVFSQGIWNTYQMTPPRIFRWERLVFDEEYMGDEFMETAEPYELRKDAMGNCLSTAVRTNGAAAIFMPGVAKKLGELMGENYYLVFTSVHEVMIHNASMVKPEELKEVLDDTLRETTPYEDFLTSHIYHYKRVGEVFSCVL